MADNRVVRTVLVAAVAVAVAVAAVGCGVSSTGPADIGDAIAAGPNPGTVEAPPGPDDAPLPADLVSAYLKAAVESGSNSLLDRLGQFLTPPAKAALNASLPDPKLPPNPVVIRVLGQPVDRAPTNERTPVDVVYQVVGQLTSQGRVDNLETRPPATMRFWVKPSAGNVPHNRIDEIKGENDNPPPYPIMISDEALGKYYQVQPVYFWDSAPSPRLIPDIRYVPNGLDAAVRANRIVQWLCDGPSPWLSDAQRLPTGAALKSPVVPKDGRLEINLTAPAAAGGAPAIQRLYRQLQWSLQSSATVSPKVDLSIDDKLQTNLGGIDDYRPSNLSYSLPTPVRRYDIVDGKVGQLSVSNQPQLLLTKENANVVYAGVNRNGSALALVRNGAGGKRSLVVVRGDGTAVPANINAVADMGRPVWAGTDVLLIPAGGKLYSVTVTGAIDDVTPSLLNKIHQVAVSPDSRRVALVADGGQAYVMSLNVTDTAATIGTNRRPILAGQVTATAVTWTSESWLYVAGPTALWRVTADSVIGNDLSSSLGGLTPTDLVAYPTPPFAPASPGPEVLLFAGLSIYQVLPPLDQDKELHAPFFGL